MPTPPSSDLTASLLAQRHVFKAFLKARIGSEAEAEDLLQDALVKALQHGTEIREDEKAVAWFYRLLRNVMVDYVRSRQAARRRDEAWTRESFTLAGDPEAERQICGCFERMLPTLKPAHAALLRRVELQGEPVSAAAAELGMTANHASVTLHRARRELRLKLEAFCGDCACLERCDCDEPVG